MRKISLLAFVILFSFGCNNSNKTAEEKTTTEDSSATNHAPVISEASKKEAHDRLEGYRQRVLKGEDMAELAKQYSEDPGSAKEGGLYKDIAKGVMVPEFEKAAFSLKPGEISEVFETQYGFHFVQLVSAHDGLVDIRHILIMPKAS